MGSGEIERFSIYLQLIKLIKSGMAVKKNGG